MIECSTSALAAGYWRPEAARRLGPTGRVAALDLSRGALLVCRERAAVPDVAAPLVVVQGEALRLPFANATFDVVMTRSVLMYVLDLPAAARELRRVLRPDGRFSTFEVVNRKCCSLRWYRGLDLAAFRPWHEQILAHARAKDPYQEAIQRFDERDAQQALLVAGFERVKLQHEEIRLAARRLPAQPAAAFFDHLVGFGLSYRAAAHAVLGEKAADYLARLGPLLVDQPQATVQAEVVLSGQ